MNTKLVKMKIYNSVDEIEDDAITDEHRKSFANLKIVHMSYGRFHMYFPLENEYERKHNEAEIRKHLLKPFRQNYNETNPKKRDELVAEKAGKA